MTPYDRLIRSRLDSSPSGSAIRLGIPAASLLVALVGLLFALDPYVVGDSTNYAKTMVHTFNPLYGYDTLVRPPLVAFLLKPLHLFLPIHKALQTLAIASGIGLVVPLYFLYRRRSDFWAPLMASFIALLPIYAPPLNWGFLTIIGVHFYIWSVYFTLRLAESGEGRVLLAGSATVSYTLVLYTNQVSALILVATVGMFTVFQLVARPTAWRNSLVYPSCGITAAFLAAPILPIYLNQFANIVLTNPGTAPPRPGTLQLSWSVLTAALRMFPLLFIAPFVLDGVRRINPAEARMALAIALLAPVSLLPGIGVAPFRKRIVFYGLPFVGYLVVVSLQAVVGDLRNRERMRRLPTLRLSSSESNRLRAVLVSLVIAILLLSAVVPYVALAVQSHWYHQTMDAESVLDSTQYIASETPEDVRFAAVPRRYAHAIEGYTTRDALEHSSILHRKGFQEPHQLGLLFSRHISVQNERYRLAFNGPYEIPSNLVISVRAIQVRIVGGEPLYRYQPLGFVNQSKSRAWFVGAEHPVSLAEASTDTTVTNDGDLAIVRVEYRFENGVTLEQVVETTADTNVVTVRYETNMPDRLERFRIALEYTDVTSVTRGASDVRTTHLEEDVPLTVGRTGGRFRYSNERGRPVLVVEASRETTLTLRVGESSSHGAYGNLSVTRLPNVLERTNVTYVAFTDTRGYTLSEVEREWFESVPYWALVYDDGTSTIYRLNRSRRPS